jgi:hypothetical protein
LRIWGGLERKRLQVTGVPFRVCISVVIEEVDYVSMPHCHAARLKPRS